MKIEYLLGEGCSATAEHKRMTARFCRSFLHPAKLEREVSMKRIKLTQNKFALVDNADYEWLNQWKWYASWDGYTWYARRRARLSAGRQFTVGMHRMILGLKRGDKWQCDHRDSNGLNNCRSNLRICTHQQNHFNQRPTRGRQFRGVCWNWEMKKWRAKICHNKESIHLGYFLSEIEGAEAYNRKAKELFGKFARLNFLKP